MGYVDEFPENAVVRDVMDDHVPFINIGIPAADLIIEFWNTDCGWPYHHTAGDTLDHISRDSLNITGRTLLHFLYKSFHPDSTLSPQFSSTWWMENRDKVIFGVGGLVVVGLGVSIILQMKKMNASDPGIARKKYGK